MTQSRAYYQTLRAIGQALEAQQLSTFDLKCSGESYLVRGETSRSSNTLQTWLQRLQGRLPKDSREVTYTPQDIERLERHGREKRRDPYRLPDFHSLSNVLRTLGAYLDIKGADLLRVQKKELSMTVLYQTRHGHPEIEERDIASFYDLSLQMYRKREKS